MVSDPINLETEMKFFDLKLTVNLYKFKISQSFQNGGRFLKCRLHGLYFGIKRLSRSTDFGVDEKSLVASEIFHKVCKVSLHFLVLSQNK